MTAPAINGAPNPNPPPRQYPPRQYLASAGLEDTTAGRTSAPIRTRAVFFTIRSPLALASSTTGSLAKQNDFLDSLVHFMEEIKELAKVAADPSWNKKLE